jgi:hypothetical protein
MIARSALGRKSMSGMRRRESITLLGGAAGSVAAHSAGAAADLARLPQLAAELAARPVDVIATAGEAKPPLGVLAWRPAASGICVQQLVVCSGHCLL